MPGRIGLDYGFGTMVGQYYMADYLLDGIRYNLLCYKENGQEIISCTATFKN